MQLTDLPTLAFQCVIEHMVMTVGLYKAVRLRLVSWYFDEEVNRAIFKTRIFAFNSDYRSNTIMRPEALARRLQGEVIRPNQLLTPLAVTIKTLAEWLVRYSEGAEKGDEKTVLDFLGTLCDAAAYHNMRPRVVMVYPNYRCEPKPFPVDPSPIDKLAAAAAVGNSQQVQNLLSQGIEPNVGGEYFGYPVQNAALNNHLNLVTLLLREPSKGTSCSDPSNSGQAHARAAALTAASSAGHDNIVQYILSTSLSLTPAMLQQHNTAAISAAASNGRIDVLRSLFLSQARFPDSTAAAFIKTQAFFTACARGYPEVVHMLLSEHGIGVNVTNDDGRNGLHMAALGGHVRVVSLLLKQGTRYYESPYGDPVYLAAKNGHENAVRVMLDAGADVDADDGNDVDIISACARNGEASMIRFLLSQGLVLEKMEGRGDRALKLAAEKGHVETVELLVGLGVNVDGGGVRDRPMLRARLLGRIEVVKALRGLGAKHVEFRDK